MIFDAIDAMQMPLFIFDNSPNIAEQFLATRFDQCLLAVFGGKDDIIIYLRVSGHGLVSIRPFQGRQIGDGISFFPAV